MTHVPIVRSPVIPWPAGEAFSMNNNGEAYFEIDLLNRKLIHSYDSGSGLETRAELLLTCMEYLEKAA